MFPSNLKASSSPLEQQKDTNGEYKGKMSSSEELYPNVFFFFFTVKCYIKTTKVNKQILRRLLVLFGNLNGIRVSVPVLFESASVSDLAPLYHPSLFDVGFCLPLVVFCLPQHKLLLVPIFEPAPKCSFSLVIEPCASLSFKCKIILYLCNWLIRIVHAN